VATTIQDLKDLIELDMLRRINKLEQDVRDLQDKVKYDILSKSERMQESLGDCEDAGVNQELIAELKLQNSMLQGQVNELKELCLICEKRAEAKESQESDDEGYW
jgi:hypothetical protein